MKKKILINLIMPKKSNQLWVSPTDNGWRTHRPGGGKSIKNTQTQQEAFEIAREIAKNQGGEVIVQGSDGKIREKNSYPPPKDNFPPKG